jgi:hypothetical protein
MHHDLEANSVPHTAPHCSVSARTSVRLLR